MPWLHDLFPMPAGHDAILVFAGAEGRVIALTRVRHFR